MPKVVHNVPGVGTVNFPDTMSEEDIQDAIVRMNESVSRSTNRTWDKYRFAEKPNPLERLGRGAQDTIDRLSQLTVAGGEAIGAYEPGTGEEMTRLMNQEQADYDANRGYKPGADFARLTGGVGMTAPLALIPGGQSVAGTVGYGALSGAAEGLFQYDPSYSLEGTTRNVAIGGLTGGIAAPVLRFASKQAQSFAEKGLGRFKGVMESTQGKADVTEIMREVPEIAGLPVEMRANLIMEAQDQIKKTGTLNMEQLARKANLIANDATPTKSMVTRDPRDWSMERNMQKLAQSPDEQISSMGQELTSVYQQNDAALGNKLKSFSANLPKGTQEAHGMVALKSLDDLERLSQKDVSELYTMVREKNGSQLASDARGLVNTLDDLKDNAYSEKLVSSVNNKLKRFGMVDKEGNLTTKTLTVEQAEELRKFVNTLPNDFGKRDIIKSIDADVLSGAGEDFFATARSAAMKRKQMLDNPATQRALNAYGELTQGKTAQNFIKTQIVDGAEQDVESLLKTFGSLPKEQAEAATNSLKAGVLDYLQEKSVNPNSGQFSGAKMNDAIRNVGEGKLQKLLGDKGLAELKSLARAGLDATYQPPYAAVNHSNTAPTLLAMTQKARAIPGVPLIVNENVEKLAGRAGYRKQLGDVLSARSQQPLPQLDPRIQSMIRMIQRAGVPAASAGSNKALDEKR
jgi:hypothetical protein